MDRFLSAKAAAPACRTTVDAAKHAHSKLASAAAAAEPQEFHTAPARSHSVARSTSREAGCDSCHVNQCTG